MKRAASLVVVCPSRPSRRFTPQTRHSIIISLLCQTFKAASSSTPQRVTIRSMRLQTTISKKLCKRKCTRHLPRSSGSKSQSRPLQATTSTGPSSSSTSPSTTPQDSRRNQLRTTPNQCSSNSQGSKNLPRKRCPPQGSSTGSPPNNTRSSRTCATPSTSNKLYWCETQLPVTSARNRHSPLLLAVSRLPTTLWSPVYQEIPPSSNSSFSSNSSNSRCAATIHRRATLTLSSFSSSSYWG